MCVSDFCLIFVLHTTTMSQKSSTVQVMRSVQLALNPDKYSPEAMDPGMDWAVGWHAGSKDESDKLPTSAIRKLSALLEYHYAMSRSGHRCVE